MAGGSLETGGALIQMAVDVDMTEFLALEASFMVMEMVTGEGHVIVTASPPDFSMGDSDFFLFGQG